LSEKHKLRVFGYRVVRKILVYKREGVTGEWRKLHNDELNGSVYPTKYYSGDQVKKNKFGGELPRVGGGENCAQDFYRKI
jgi:hypothetical protein